jgi:hypothetical protein
MALPALKVPILATRFMSGEMGTHRLLCAHLPSCTAVAVAALFYDHALTFLDELELVWFNSRASRGSRVGFLLNRYVTEIMMVYICYSEFALLIGRVGLITSFSTLPSVLSGTSESMTTEVS